MIPRWLRPRTGQPRGQGGNVTVVQCHPRVLQVHSSHAKPSGGGQHRLEHDLADADQPATAVATTTVSTCHLDCVQADAAKPCSTVTAVSPERREILVALGLEHLLDDRHVGDAIRPS